MYPAIYEHLQFQFLPESDEKYIYLLLKCTAKIVAITKTYLIGFNSTFNDAIDKCTGMGGLVISRSDCRAISERRCTTAHFTVVSTVLWSGNVENKTVSCVLMNVNLVTMI
jgi:hypothetical protein